MKYIVTVCRGNIARSVFAQEVIKKELETRGLKDTYISLSRGVQGTAVDPEPVKFPNITYYEDLYRDSKPTLDMFGIDLSSHVSTKIDQKTAELASILLAVDQKTKDALIFLFPNHRYKVHLLSELIGVQEDISDPEVTSGSERQEKIFTQIHKIITQGFSRLLLMLED